MKVKDVLKESSAADAVGGIGSAVGQGISNIATSPGDQGIGGIAKAALNPARMFRGVSVQDQAAQNNFVSNFVSKATKSLQNAINQGLVDPNSKAMPATISTLTTGGGTDPKGAGQPPSGGQPSGQAGAGGAGGAGGAAAAPAKAAKPRAKKAAAPAAPAAPAAAPRQTIKQKAQAELQHQALKKQGSQAAPVQQPQAKSFSTAKPAPRTARPAAPAAAAKQPTNNPNLKVRPAAPKKKVAESYDQINMIFESIYSTLFEAPAAPGAAPAAPATPQTAKAAPVAKPKAPRPKAMSIPQWVATKFIPEFLHNIDISSPQAQKQIKDRLSKMPASWSLSSSKSELSDIAKIAWALKSDLPTASDQPTSGSAAFAKGFASGMGGGAAPATDQPQAQPTGDQSLRSKLKI